MERQKEFKQTVAEYLEETLGGAESANDSYRLPYQMMGLIRCPDDIEAAIAEIFIAFDRVRKKKDKIDGWRLWGLFGLILMVTGIITAKGPLPIIGFLCGAIVVMIFLSKAQKEASPLKVEIKAYEGVLLKLHEMKIMREQAWGESKERGHV
jgi:hypothetical protein